ncbi:hypothetical protein [Paratractidigestivibacter faecalis]|uniref:hypothetical protein n=1 Tax=Paratractidigestivibacter faecalis TaxID=2292441 RepID=UPI003AB6ED5D
MSEMGRDPLPLAVLEARGKSHLSSSEKRARAAREVPPANADATPPAWLSEDGMRGRFSEIAAMLSDLGVWDATCADELGRYVVAQTGYERLSAMWLDALAAGDADGAAALQRQQDRAYQQAHRSASSLGLNLTSRCKVAPVRPAEPPGEKLEL